MTKFSIGDLVRCIDTTDTDLSEFETYRVTDLMDEMIGIDGVCDGAFSFLASRFMLDDELANDCSESQPDLLEDYLDEMDTLSDNADYLDMAIEFIERNYSAEPEDDESFLAVSELMRQVFGLNVGIRPTAYEFTFSEV